MVAAATTASLGATTTYTHGYDVSWPQCTSHGNGTRIQSMPAHGARYVILGLTHGLGHTRNPCLPAQLSWAKAHHVPVGAYLVPSYPTARQRAAAADGPIEVCDADDTACRLRNDGASQAADALATMRNLALPAPMVWVDVEFRHVQPWTHDRAANREVLQGVFDELSSARIRYGIYTTSYMWSHITGSWRVRVPNWLPAGSGKASAAQRTCRTSGTGGTTWLAQYTRSYDENLTCPSMDATAGHHGSLYRYRNTVLQLGDHGAAVVALQRALGSPTQVTGQFDDQTLATVVAMQAKNLLPVDGRVDNDDWRALGAYRLYGAHGFLLSQLVAPVK